MKEITKDDCRVRIAPSRGAIVTSLEVAGSELLYLDGESFDDPARNVRGGIPVLFPLCGPLATDTYSIGGEEFAMKQHGFARTHVWNVLEQVEDRLDLELTETASTLAQFPFAFRYELSFQAQRDGLLIEQRIENRSAESMPCQFGFHPYFCVGEKYDLSFDLPVSTYSDNKSDDHGAFEGFDFSRDEIDWAFPHPDAPQAAFVDPSKKTRVEVSFEESYSQLVFWTLKGSPFVCVEPWSSSRLGFPKGLDVHQIKPRDTLSTWVKIRATQV